MPCRERPPLAGSGAARNRNLYPLGAARPTGRDPSKPGRDLPLPRTRAASANGANAVRTPPNFGKEGCVRETHQEFPARSGSKDPERIFPCLHGKALLCRASRVEPWNALALHPWDLWGRSAFVLPRTFRKTGRHTRKGAFYHVRRKPVHL